MLYHKEFTYYFSCVTTCTILHEPKFVPPDYGNDVFYKNIFIDFSILALVYFIYIHVCPPGIPHSPVNHDMELPELPHLNQIL